MIWILAKFEAQVKKIFPHFVIFGWKGVFGELQKRHEKGGLLEQQIPIPPFCGIHTLGVHFAHAAANLNSGYSKYAKVARVRIIFVQLHSEHLA